MNARTLKDQRILITGGAGLVGSHIADMLVDGGAAEVVVFDNFTRGRLENLAHARAAIDQNAGNALDIAIDQNQGPLSSMGSNAFVR